MKIALSSFFIFFTLFSLQLFAGVEDFLGTWGATNTRGELITINIQERQVEFNLYQVSDNGLVDLHAFPEWMLDNLESQLMAISSDSVLFPYAQEKNRILLKFQPIDATLTTDIYLYLDQPNQFSMKTPGTTDSPTLKEIIGKLTSSYANPNMMTEANFIKIR